MVKKRERDAGRNEPMGGNAIVDAKNTMEREVGWGCHIPD
jgi:hypothetical protein